MAMQGILRFERHNHDRQTVVAVLVSRVDYFKYFAEDFEYSQSHKKGPESCRRRTRCCQQTLTLGLQHFLFSVTVT